MNDILKLFVSMSFSGSLLIVLLLLGRPFYQNRTCRRWQYHIWLIVIARLLLPFSPEENLSSALTEQASKMIARYTATQEKQSALPAASKDPSVSLSVREDALPEETDTASYENTGSDPASSPAGYSTDILSHLWIIWLGVAALLLIRKITVYQSFAAYLKAGWEEVTDVHLLNLLAQTGERAGVRRPLELYTNHLVSSPLLLGFFHPCIVLPSAELSDTDFSYTVWHEMIHYRRKDMFYKWLMQITLCLHWFNPLVRLMSHMLDRACELACDETVIRTLDETERRSYGDTLLHALQTGGSYDHPLPSVMLGQSGKHLKERLYVIMTYQKSSKFMVLFSAVLTAALIAGAAAAGVTTPAGTRTSGSGTVTKMQSKKSAASAANRSSLLAENYYQTNNIPAFGSLFATMDEETQHAWLKKIYKDQSAAFFSISLQQLETDSPLITAFAKKAYQDDNLSFFSILINHMHVKTQKNWLKKAEKDGQYLFQKILMKALSDLEDKPEQLQTAGYKQYGITSVENTYYYQEKPVYLLLDMQENSSNCFTVMNPDGTVSIKITRNEEGRIKSVKLLTDAEVKELTEGRTSKDDPEKNKTVNNKTTKAGGTKITIPISFDKLKGGIFVWLGTYRLDENDKVYYKVSAKTGQQLEIGFAKANSKDHPKVTYQYVSNYRTDGKLQIRTGAMSWKDPLKPGTYRLFIRAGKDDLTNVNGTAVIKKAESM